jgi:hypothetical protein
VGAERLEDGQKFNRLTASMKPVERLAVQWPPWRCHTNPVDARPRCVRRLHTGAVEKPRHESVEAGDDEQFDQFGVVPPRCQRRPGRVGDAVVGRQFVRHCDQGAVVGTPLMGVGCLGQCCDFVVGQAAPQPDDGVLSKLVDSFGVPADPQDHELAFTFGQQSLVEDETAHQVEPLEELWMVPQHPEDIQRTPVERQRTGQRFGELRILDAIKVDRLDAWAGRARCSHVGALGRGLFGRWFTGQRHKCR